VVVDHVLEEADVDPVGARRLVSDSGGDDDEDAGDEDGRHEGSQRRQLTALRHRRRVDSPSGRNPHCN
jgi:hypothetical protein